MKPIPEGWMKYEALGQCVPGTKLIAFKVPLKQQLCDGRIPEEDWFTPAILLQKQPRLKTIIDLTDTQRYYDPQEFEGNGVTHIKINITGGGRLPPSFKMRQFFEAVDEFMEKYSNDPDALIGVHCTHGLNRTGYFICNYMVNRLKISPEDAISQFESARGYPMERRNYIKNIKPMPEKKSRPTRRGSDEYSSPLYGGYEDEPRRLDMRSRPGFSRDPYRREIGGRSYNDRTNREYDSNYQWRRTRENPISSSHVDARQRHADAWKSWRSYKRDSENQDRNSSSSSRNWRERP